MFWKDTPRVLRTMTCGATLLGLTGCAARPARDQASVSAGIEERTGRGIRPDSRPAAPLPSGVSLEDGITQDEAVAIALWNNPAFQADLTRLGIARADLSEVSFLRNPVFSLLFPLGSKQLEVTAKWPIEQFWLRPRRIKIAQKEVEHVAESLVQEGLNLTRDVRVAHANTVSSKKRRQFADEKAGIVGEIAEIMQARLRAGDISEWEANQAQLQAEQAREEAQRATRDAGLATERLRGLLGWSEAGTEIRVTESALQRAAIVSRETLLKDALAARPDLRASELAIEAAGEKAKLEKSKIFSLTAIFDANAEGKKGFEAGPGMEADVPLANLNQGGRARANAGLEAALKSYGATRQRIAQEVREAMLNYTAAQTSTAQWQEKILPRVEEDARLSEKAHAAGELSYLAVLGAKRNLLEARVRAEEASTEESRAQAELDRSVGKRVFTKTP